MKLALALANRNIVAFYHWFLSKMFVWKKTSVILMFISSSSDKFKLLQQNSVTSVLDQHGVSIKNSINMGKTFIGISRVWKNVPTWILARILGICFHFPVSVPYLLNDSFIFDGLTLKTSNNMVHCPFALQVVEAT